MVRSMTGCLEGNNNNETALSENHDTQALCPSQIAGGPSDTVRRYWVQMLFYQRTRSSKRLIQLGETHANKHSSQSLLAMIPRHAYNLNRSIITVPTYSTVRKLHAQRYSSWLMQQMSLNIDTGRSNICVSTNTQSTLLLHNAIAAAVVVVAALNNENSTSNCFDT